MNAEKTRHIRELHEKAMDMAETASVARLRGDAEQAERLYRQALRYEAGAAGMVPTLLSCEPSRSVLYRSAASLALDCGEVREAEQLAAAGLAGHPPGDIADELRDLLGSAETADNVVRTGDMTSVTFDMDPSLLAKLDEMAEKFDMTRDRLMHSLLESAYEDNRASGIIGIRTGMDVSEKLRQIHSHI